LDPRRGRNAREGGGMRDSVGAEDGPMVRARPNTDDGKKGGNYGGEATGEDSGEAAPEKMSTRSAKNKNCIPQGGTKMKYRR